MKNDEYVFVQKLIKQFNHDFEVLTEVKSQCKTSRIDLILIFQGKFIFGIECKNPDKKKGHEIFEYVKQAHRYTQMKWQVHNQFLQAPILICPALSYNYFLMNQESKIIDGQLWHKDRHTKTHIHHSFNGFLAGFGIGEVRRLPDNGYQFAMNNEPLFRKFKYYNGQVCAEVHEVNYASHMAKIKEYDSAI